MTNSSLNKKGKKETIKKVWIKEKVYLSGKGEIKSVLGSEIIEFQDANGKWHTWNPRPYIKTAY